MRRDHGERGAVTMEAAMVLPALMAVTVAMAWMVCLGVAHVMVVDAAREGARVAARGDGAAAAVAISRRVAGPHSRVSVAQRGERVVVTVTARVRGPGRLFAFLAPVTVHAEAVAEREPGS